MAHGASCLRAVAPFLVFLLVARGAGAASEEELFFKGTASVNEGKLHFLTQPPAEPVHHLSNRITINDASLSQGWIALEQCHEHLDTVPRAQIVYGKGRMRDLRVVSARGIGQAWTEDNSVQLRDVHPGATICIHAESRALAKNGDMSFNLSNGPYMRKFLDGYYPMRVSMTVRLDTDKLHFVGITPEAQPGFQVWHRGKEIGYEAYFEGRLTTVIRFDRTDLR